MAQKAKSKTYEESKTVEMDDGTAMDVNSLGIEIPFFSKNYIRLRRNIR